MKPEDTRTQILNTAQDLIQKVGLNGMSYADISHVVGIRKASIHYHFPTKDDLVIALLNRYSPSFFRLVDGIFDAAESSEDKLRRYCNLFETTLNSGDQDRVCLCGMLGAEFNTLGVPLIDQVEQFYQKNQDYLARLLKEGKKNGEFNFSGSEKVMANLIFSLLEGGLIIARVKHNPVEFSHIVEQLMQIVKG